MAVKRDLLQVTRFLLINIFMSVKKELQSKGLIKFAHLKVQDKFPKSSGLFPYLCDLNTVILSLKGKTVNLNPTKKNVSQKEFEREPSKKKDK